jgi:hypothetical protein
MVQLSKVFEVFIRHVPESAIRVSELFLLLLVEFLPAALLAFMHRVGKPDLPDISSFSQMEQCPRARCRRSVLTGHQKGDHHVRDIRIGQRSSVLVGRALQCRDHVVFMLCRYSAHVPMGSTGTHVVRAFTSFADDALVKLAHSLLGLVPSSVTRQRKVREHEVDRCESAIEVFVAFSERLVELRTNFFAL